MATPTSENRQKVDVDVSVADEKSENLEPWAQRWENKNIGFHLSDVNPVLRKYANNLLGLPSTSEDGANNANSPVATTRLFVPLCGKTLDMAYLVPKCSEVVGVDGIRVALEEFAKEQPQLQVECKGVKDGFEQWEGDKILLLRGDYFHLDTSKTNGKFGAVYDRGSLVAIDPNLRKAYVDILGDLLEPGGKILFVALHRRGEEEAVKRGPPFSFSEDTVRDTFEGLEWVESVIKLEERDEFESNADARERYPGLDQLMETVYLVQAKGNSEK